MEGDSFELDEGDAVLYAGYDQEHWRPGIYKGEGMAQVFFHYVDKNGPFKDHAYDINLNSTKSMTGHLLGAAGAIEAIASILSINNNIIPPTINHENFDDKIDSNLNFTFGKAQKKEINYAMSNTFGFGGHNACVIFKKI